MATRKKQKQNILFAVSECVPYAKTGGLADVAGALPGALKKQGCDARIIMPLYRQCLNRTGKLKTVAQIAVPISGIEHEARILEGKTPSGNIIYFVDSHRYFDREGLYQEDGEDYPDNCERFVFFSRAVMEMLKTLKWTVDVIHCHDWFAGLIPIYLKTLYSKEKKFKQTASVFTIHNLAYQGLFWHYDMHLTGLGWNLFTYDNLEFYGKMNFMKGGIVFADLITTVSEKYAEEIQTPEFGCGLESTLNLRSDALYGVLNGVDYAIWDPTKDNVIKARYSASTLAKKAKCKEDLQKSVGLPAADVPVLGIISRITEQKGFDLLKEIMSELLSREIQLVILGQGEEEHEFFLKELVKEFPDKISITTDFSDDLAHKIEAGSDIFLMPSRFEPCGLNQLYSLKYGTVPVVRATGCLADTIIDADANPKTGNGFVFEDYAGDHFMDAVDRALDAYEESKRWIALQKRGMAADFSWIASARKYMQLYVEAKKRAVASLKSLAAKKTASKAKKTSAKKKTTTKKASSTVRKTKATLAKAKTKPSPRKKAASATRAKVSTSKKATPKKKTAVKKDAKTSVTKTKTAPKKKTAAKSKIKKSASAKKK